jgi:phosphatidylserine/phosphatidylglycerophosphate/cardiolipin synthase-like enzyme
MRFAGNDASVIDDELTITGSFNFTHNAEAYNAENRLLIHSKELAARYADNWKDHARHSEPYARAMELKDEHRKPGKVSLWPFR